ncbi:hypothetical protein CHLRE_01g032900v5 [Chlamydomonas reinhardtii]|uniref:Uncharacterized protein n=1 Tax=Chlamydomonas reinhardtii TaxID=3055 RepID=A0A2K3E6T9_CHLRE|nr:uncharacterized protein CHLRE_01g032900v5 [Chlamydomonas reinhardtii]XP_042928580.1 uncharacterized protein CHLRE_01g032900v5 [Chlamydomonas reinhardtii]PNW88515.1 hypothetical protein CHLRE_01g032900v5 [Chlamydomonas reinhardtii]PNW88516.1 hypothetical protein CHLRE_01g032900v5 [Chlamydomonas reinhardtii]
MSISKVSARRLQRISSALGMKQIEAVSEPPLDAQPVLGTESFTWTSCSESNAAQPTAAIPWMKRNIPAPPKHEWIDCVGQQHMLDCRLPGADVLALKGSCDLALCTSAAVQAFSPHLGLRIVVELKKEVKSGHVDQLAAKLVAANSVSPNFKPIAVMTDLVDAWLIAWIGRETIMIYPCHDRAKAVGILRAFLDKEHLTQDSAHIAQQPEQLTAAESGAEAEVGRLLKRQRLPTGAAAGRGNDVANLEDLLDFADDLDEADMHQIKCYTLQQLLRERYAPVAPAVPPA